MKILCLWKDIFKNIKMQPQKKKPEEKTPPNYIQHVYNKPIQLIQ